jgi:hypothetical protein
MTLNPLDVQHEEKRIRSVLKSAEGRQAVRNALGLNIRFDEYDDPPKVKLPKVAVLVPSHDTPRKQTTDSYRNMLMYSQGKVELLPQPSVSSSIVHWVRNELMVRLDKAKVEHEWVLWMDDDMVPSPDALVRLLAHNVDIVAGACTVRNDPPVPNFRIWDEKVMGFRTAVEWDREGLVEIGAVGTGFMLCSKKAMDEVAEYYLSCGHEKKYMQYTDSQAQWLEEKRRAAAERTGNKWWFRFLPHPLADGEYGEDISFCFAARERGLKVHVDTTVRPRHIGDYGYALDDFEPYRQEMLMQERTEGRPTAEALTEDIAALVEG